MVYGWSSALRKVPLSAKVAARASQPALPPDMASSNASTEGYLDNLPDDQSCELLGPTALASFLACIFLTLYLMIDIADCPGYLGSCGTPLLSLQETQRDTQTTVEDLVRQSCLLQNYINMGHLFKAF